MGKEHRLVVLGAPGVGKSALTVRFLTGRFLHRYDPTLEDEYCTQADVDGETFQLRILDTAGQDPLFLQSYCRSADALLIAFSLTDQSSLDTAQDILQVACRDGRRPPAVLVGTKSDLQTERQVSFEKGLALAKGLGCAYSETSAATHINVTQAFHLAVKLSVYSSSSSETNLCGGCVANLENKLQQSARKGVREVLRKWSTLSRKKKLSSILPQQTGLSALLGSA